MLRYIFENFVYPIITELIAGYILIILSRLQKLFNLKKSPK
jgi:hypothetical protein